MKAPNAEELARWEKLADSPALGVRLPVDLTACQVANGTFKGFSTDETGKYTLKTVLIRIPAMEVKSEPNMRGHTRWKAGRIAKQRKNVEAWLYGQTPPKLPCVVTLTRQYKSPKRDFDLDNLQGAMKAIRDEVAVFLQTDDRSDQIEWVYRQEKAEQTGVIIYIRTKELP